jgi:hypothetical protein
VGGVALGLVIGGTANLIAGVPSTRAARDVVEGTSLQPTVG